MTSHESVAANFRCVCYAPTAAALTVTTCISSSSSSTTHRPTRLGVVRPPVLFPPAHPHAATASRVFLLYLLGLLPLFALVWPAPPALQKLQLPPMKSRSNTPSDAAFRQRPATTIGRCTSGSSDWLVFALAQSCCKKKAAAAAAAAAADDSVSKDSTDQGRRSTQTGDNHSNEITSATSEERSDKEKADLPLSPATPGGPKCCGVMPMYFVNSTHTIILFSWWETLEEWQYAISVLVCILLGVLSVLLKVVRMRVEQKLVSSDVAAAAAAALEASAAAAAATAMSTRAQLGCSNIVSDLQENAEKNNRRSWEKAAGASGVATANPDDAHKCSSSTRKPFYSSKHQGQRRRMWCGVLAAAARPFSSSSSRRRRCGGVGAFPFRSNCCRMLQAFILYGYDYLLMLIVMSYNVGLFFAVTGGLALGFFFFGHLLVSRRCSNSNTRPPQLHHFYSEEEQGAKGNTAALPREHKHGVEMQDFYAGDPLCCGA